LNIVGLYVRRSRLVELGLRWLLLLLMRHAHGCCRLRAAPRVIKRKIPKWHVERRHHAD